MTTDDNAWGPPPHGFFTPDEATFETEDAVADEKAKKIDMQEHAEKFSAYATDFLIGSAVLGLGIIVLVICTKFAVWLWHVL